MRSLNFPHIMLLSYSKPVPSNPNLFLLGGRSPPLTLREKCLCLGRQFVVQTTLLRPYNQLLLVALHQISCLEWGPKTPRAKIQSQNNQTQNLFKCFHILRRYQTWAFPIFFIPNRKGINFFNDPSHFPNPRKIGHHQKRVIFPFPFPLKKSSH